MASNDIDPWGGGGPGSAEKLKLPRSVREKYNGSNKGVASVAFEKTKVAASVSFEKTKFVAMKVKDGAAVGVNWMKLKYELYKKKN